MSDIELPWADAPEGAVAAAMEDNGMWFWIIYRPVDGLWHCAAEGIAPSPPRAADWRKSLQFRPVDAAPKMPDGLPPLPDGWEYVGMGSAMPYGAECMALKAAHTGWHGPFPCEQHATQHYARRKPSAEQSESIPCDVGEVRASSDDFLLELADRGYTFRIDEDGITAWREDGDD